MICHYCVHIGHQYCLGAGCECPTCAEKKSQAPTPSGPKWTPPKLIVKAFIDPLAWGIRTADYDEPVCEIPQREHAKQYADLFVASPELLEALEPDDRLNAGNVIHAGYKSTCSLETVHLLHCCLAQMQSQPERFSVDMMQKARDEIQRLIDRAEKALAKARGETPGVETRRSCEQHHAFTPQTHYTSILCVQCGAIASHPIHNVGKPDAT